MIYDGEETDVRGEGEMRVSRLAQTLVKYFAQML